MTPALHRSTAAVYPVRLTISGAMYMGVPHIVCFISGFMPVRRSWMDLARPKSAILTVERSSSSRSKRFSS